MSVAQQFLQPMLGGAQFDWFVDSVNGDDANSGKTAGNAFQTIAALESAGISAGDKIGLAAGSIFYEQLDISVSNVSVESYNSGDRPFIDCSDQITNGDFAKTGGQTNVYEASITPAWEGATEEFRVWEDDVHLEYVADVATCDSTPGSYTQSGTSGTITVYVHASDSSSVITNGKTYAGSVRFTGIDANGNAITVKDIRLRRALGFGGMILPGPGSLIENCRFEAGASHLMVVDGPVTVSDCEFYDAYKPSGDTIMLTYNQNSPDPDVAHITIIGCTFEMPDDTVSWWNTVSGIHGHVSVGGEFGTVHIEDCVFTDMQKGIDACNDCKVIEVVDCSWIDCANGILHPSSVVTSCEMTITGGDWDCARNVGRFATLTNTSVSTTLIEDTNISHTARTPSTGTIIISSAIQATIQDCVFESLVGSGGSRIAIWCNNNGADLTLQRNEFSGTDGWDNYYEFDAGASGMTWFSDHNTFGSPIFRMEIFGVAYTDLPTYQAAVAPNDANST